MAKKKITKTSNLITPEQLEVISSSIERTFIKMFKRIIRNALKKEVKKIIKKKARG